MKVRHALAAGVLVVAMVLVSAGQALADETSPPERLSTLDAAILGVVEGLTEYLPVSSTGHLILANHAMGLSRFKDPAHPLTSGIEKLPGVDAFDIVIQLGAILAVLGLYRKRVWQMLRGLAGKDPAGLRLVVSLAMAFLPAAFVGLFFHHWITERLFNPISVVGALAVGGVLMIVVEHYAWRRRRNAKWITNVCDVRLWQALAIGAAQCLGMWPGTSRSMITILAARLRRGND